MLVASFVGPGAGDVQAATWYVRCGSAGDGSLANPLGTIQEAIDAARNCDIILMAECTYPEYIVIDGISLFIKGGWNAAFSERDCAANVTTITGGGAGRCLTYTNSAAGEVPGFTIRNGHAQGDAPDCYGGGVYCEDSSPKITGNIVVGNTATEGGDIACHDNSSPAITNNTIAGNTGGGVYCESSDATVTNCILWDNTDQIQGGSATYCCIQGCDPVQENIAADPLFADPDNGDYHLKSRSGRWDPGLDGVGGFRSDDVTSRCIDAGDPQSEKSNETMLNGCRVNIGAYGNTAEASRSRWIIDGDLTGDGKVNVLDWIYIRNRLNTACH